MEITFKDRYRWADAIIASRKTASFMKDARNKPDSRFAKDFAKQVIEFAEDDDNLEALTTEGQRELKTIKNKGAKVDPFSLTSF